ncbi:MAG: purine-nucleoside phosphorylase [Proteobacteria bacterium]|nr:purine-nucleoside phosphorylase [Pseudomonadota bacterium]
MVNDLAFEAAQTIRTRRPDFLPRAAIILGSGLGSLADRMEDASSIGFGDLAGFPVSTVQGHAGELVLGKLSGVPVACLKGRAHYYEGYGAGVMTSAVRTLKLLGCELLLATCAAGSLRVEVEAGSLVAITDHINLLPGTPLIGPNDDRFGPRFFSMANAYDQALRDILKATAAAKQISLHEGVYLACPGPNFETAAEIRMMRTLGADLVGMSMVPEVISARHCGLRVVGVAVVTNLAEGLTTVALTHEQTLENAAMATTDLVALIHAFVQRIAQSATIPT